MKKTVIILISLSIAAASAALYSGFSGNLLAQTAPNQMINITSPAFSNEGGIPAKYTCDGSNAVPEMDISGVPSNAKSLAVVVDDPDAPMGNFNHWIAWNIDPSVKNISENMMPSEIVSGKNSAGKNGYIGPCPPSGTHRYFFKVFALDDRLGLDQNANEGDLMAAMDGHIIGQGELMGKYAR